MLSDATRILRDYIDDVIENEVPQAPNAASKGPGPNVLPLHLASSGMKLLGLRDSDAFYVVDSTMSVSAPAEAEV